MNAASKAWIKKYCPEIFLRFYWFYRVAQFRLLRFVPRYDEDELITAHKCDFVNDPHFKACYDGAVRDGLAISPTIQWRAHTICWAAARGMQLEGDFVECGVNRGFLSKIAIDFVGFGAALNKTFYLMDTYDGLVEEHLTQAERAMGKKAGGYEPCYEFVARYFSPFNNVKVIQGAIPGSLDRVTPEKVAFLSIDMNCTAPEIAALVHFWDRLVPGACVVLDDYGHAGHEEQKTAFDRFASDHNVPLLALPTGQGLMIKP
jgi:hypothetical protein